MRRRSHHISKGGRRAATSPKRPAIARRELLAGAAASLAVVPFATAAALGNGDERVRRVLAGLDELTSPRAKLARLAALSTEGLSHGAALDLVTARDGLAVDARLADIFPYGELGRSPYVVGPSSGAWRKSAEAGDLSALPERIDAETRQLIADVRAGVVLPEPFHARTIALVREAASNAKGTLSAALSRQADAMAALPVAPDEAAGMWRLPNGEAYYALMLERQLGEAVDAAAAHRRLIGKWHALSRQAERLLAAQGFRDGSIGDRFVAMFRDPRWHYPDTSAGRDRAVADMNGTLAKARARVPQSIGPVPDFCLEVRARRMTPADEAAGKGGYRIVATPTVPGAYFVDLSQIARRPSWSLGSVVHHELLPGHMVQMPIEQIADPDPLRLEYAPAMSEGWAVYAEALAMEAGAFDGDDRGRLGALHWLLFRIGRAIVDTGIHHARWSREQALDTLRSVQGEPAFFAPFESDIDRICLNPGIRAAEALTWLRLEDLRRDAGASTMDSEAMRRFHQIVLADGRKRLTTIEAELRGHAPFATSARSTKTEQ